MSPCEHWEHLYTVFSHFVHSYGIVCVNICSGGGQLLGNNDGVKIPLGGWAICSKNLLFEGLD